MKRMCVNKQQAFSLMELMVVVALVSVLATGASVLFSSGTETWFATEGHVRLQENVRQVLHRVSRELRQTTPGNIFLFDGAGLGNSDVIAFSIPVMCEAGQEMVDSNGDVAHWGAPLTWGCTQSTCMDADNDCSTVDYKIVEYRINSDGEFVRRVLAAVGGTVVAEDVFAFNIKDIQYSISGSVVTIGVSSEVTTSNKRTLTAQASMDVYLRN